MGSKITTDTDQLRRGADTLARANAESRSVSIDPGQLGSRRSRGAFESFEQYWQPARSGVTESVDSLAEALRSAADGYEQRDSTAADEFRAAARAF